MVIPERRTAGLLRSLRPVTRRPDGGTPNGCGAGIDSDSAVRRLFLFRPGARYPLDELGDASVAAGRVDPGDEPTGGSRTRRIASTCATARASFSGASTNARTAPSGPMKIDVGRPGGWYSR